MYAVGNIEKSHCSVDQVQPYGNEGVHPACYTSGEDGLKYSSKVHVILTSPGSTPGPEGPIHLFTTHCTKHLLPGFFKISREEVPSEYHLSYLFVGNLSTSLARAALDRAVWPLSLRLARRSRSPLFATEGPCWVSEDSLTP